MHAIGRYFADLASVLTVFAMLVAGYKYMPQEWRIATEGWVLTTFGARSDFTARTISLININYYEKKKCKFPDRALTDDEFEILTISYRLYEETGSVPHKYTTMTREKICADRLREDQ